MKNEREKSADGGSSPPPIAEKVKFWQEQDRINQLMIPRVVRLSKGLGDLCVRMDSLEAGEKTATWKYVASLEQRLSDVEEKLGLVLEDKALSRQVSYTLVLAWSALAIATLSLACALFA